MDVEPAEEYELYAIEDLIDPDGILNGGAAGPAGAPGAPERTRARSDRGRRRRGWLRRLFGGRIEDDDGDVPAGRGRSRSSWG
jgi:hypothetical protein